MTQLGVGGIGGFLVGYAAKKALKIIAVILGIGILGLLYLANTGVISINYDKLREATSGLSGSTGIFTGINQLLVNLPFAGSFVVGIGLGWKYG